MTEDRKTFTVPDGCVAVRDEEGRATGEVVAYDPTTQPFDEPFRHVDRKRAGTAGPETRFINCEVCQTEGRILRSNGGPDDIDYGVCPACNGKREVEVECSPITISDIENAEWY